MKDFFSKIVTSDLQRDILVDMKMEELPLVIWGGGSMSYSVRKILKRNNIPISACWIDNPDIIELDGIPVMPIEEIIKKYGTVNVVFGHSKYELADDVVKKEGINKCFCLINVCYEQWNHLSYEFVKKHAEDYFITYNLLEDELSKECMVAYLNCKITEDFRYLLPVCSETASYFENPFFKIGDEENLVDVGAYDGDTIREFLQVTNTYNKIHAIEPEHQSFLELKKYVEKQKMKDIELYQCGCWNSNTVLHFREDEESSRIEMCGKEELKVYKLDDLLQGQEASIIKINFLNGVCETLDGASYMIRYQKPKLIIMVGFDEWGLIKIPKKIKELNPNYKVALRYASAMPARLTLFAY